MANIVVLFPKLEDGKRTKALLARHGFAVSAVCTSGTAALQAADKLGEGIIICGYRFQDMIYEELYENLPSTFDMLLLASEKVFSDGIAEGVYGVEMPLKVRELLEEIEKILTDQHRKRKKRSVPGRQRSEAQLKILAQAKELLMVRNQITEEEAHRYLQKTSMDNGTNIIETAQMILSLMS